jgi:hypothetical protein
MAEQPNQRPSPVDGRFVLASSTLAIDTSRSAHPLAGWNEANLAFDVLAFRAQAQQGKDFSLGSFGMPSEKKLKKVEGK